MINAVNYEAVAVIAALFLALILIGAGLIVEKERRATSPEEDDGADLLARWAGDPIPLDVLDELARDRWQD